MFTSLRPYLGQAMPAMNNQDRRSHERAPCSQCCATTGVNGLTQIKAIFGGAMHTSTLVGCSDPQNYNRHPDRTGSGTGSSRDHPATGIIPHGRRHLHEPPPQPLPHRLGLTDQHILSYKPDLGGWTDFGQMRGYWGSGVRLCMAPSGVSVNPTWALGGGVACLMARRRSPVFAPRDGWGLGRSAGEEVSVLDRQHLHH